jgi:hypothetical protein
MNNSTINSVPKPSACKWSAEKPPQSFSIATPLLSTPSARGATCKRSNWGPTASESQSRASTDFFPVQKKKQLTPDFACVLCGDPTRSGEHVCPKCMDAVLKEQALDLMNVNQTLKKGTEKNEQ